MGTNFREILRTELDYLGLTVKELSAKTGIAKGTLDCYLGVRSSMPPADVAVKIADAVGVSVEYLVTGREEKSRNMLPLYDHAIRSIIQIMLKLDEKDNEIILELAKALKKRAESGIGAFSKPPGFEKAPK
jgi:transcriptional regulator with XRE-family HTH domain